MREALTVSEISGRTARVLSGFPNVAAAVLLGSCSRGEETCCRDAAGRSQLLSDFEMIVVVEDLSRACEIGEALRELGRQLRQFAASPFFALEWSFYAKRRLPYLDRRFLQFETKACGKVIYGDQGILSRFPEITVSNLNFAELDTVILHRLYHVARDFYRAGERQKKYLLARNTLDIPTVVLPYEGILLPTYAKRVALFERAGYGSDGLRLRLRDYLEMKLDFSSPLYGTFRAEEMLADFSRDMRDLYEYMSRSGRGGAFHRDRRALMRSAVRGGPSAFLGELDRPRIQDRLCRALLAYLEQSGEDSEKLAGFGAEMWKLFRYR